MTIPPAPSDESAAPADGSPAPGRAFTVRALVTGASLVIGVAVLTPLNDWLIDNTYFYSQHLPVGVLLLVLLIGAVINPLLGRHRYRMGELLVITGMLLVLGGVASSGLTRYFPATVAGPARSLAGGTSLNHLVTREGEVQLPSALFVGMPAHGRPDQNDPEYRYIVEGFHTGLSPGYAVDHRSTVRWRDAAGEHEALAFAGPGAQRPGRLDLASPLGRAMAGRPVGTWNGPDGPFEILAIHPPGVPWGAWGSALLAWLPLLGSTFVAAIALAGIVRKQWIDHERLPFPIANAIASFLGEPEPGRRLPPVFRERGFWVGFAIVALILLSNGIAAFGWWPFPVPTEIRLQEILTGAPWSHVLVDWGIWNWRIFFSIVALTFFLPTDLSFSMWFFFVAVNLVVMGVHGATGVDIQTHHGAAAMIGGYAVGVLLILYVGRSYYLRLLLAAFRRSDDAETRTGAWYARFFLLGLLGMVAAMMLLGARAHHALIATGVYLGMMLLLARLVAEAGIPFVQWPWAWVAPQIIYSLTGFTVPVAALVPLALLGQTLCADSRENLLPFAVNAEYLGQRARAPRLGLSGALLAVLIAGTVIAGGTLVWSAYHNDGMGSHDGYWQTTMGNGFTPLNNAAAGGAAAANEEIWASYGVGAAVTGALGVCRLLFAWWPLHPLGFLIAVTYPTAMVWFSFFLGWLAKFFVMRYGGMQLYRRLKPVALGVIAGEAMVIGGFLVLGLFTKLPQGLKFLPG